MLLLLSAMYLWDPYRLRYSLSFWISIALAIRSFDCTLQM